MNLQRFVSFFAVLRVSATLEVHKDAGLLFSGKGEEIILSLILCFE